MPLRTAGVAWTTQTGLPWPNPCEGRLSARRAGPHGEGSRRGVGRAPRGRPERGEAQTCVVSVGGPAGTYYEREEDFAVRDLAVGAEGAVTFETSWGERIVCPHPLPSTVRIDAPPGLG